MKNNIKIKCPAKINLKLKVTGKREDGFHNIESIMQTIDLFDFLTITIEDYTENKIILTGNSDKIPYDEHNLVYKATKLFLDKTGIKNKKILINIEKKIPVCAGLAGGSTDGAGTIFGLNEIFDTKFSEKELDELCALLGSDLNVCLHGGRILAKGRGEIIESLPFEELNLSLIKPLNLGISAKEAYTKYSQKKEISTNINFENDLEWAVIDDYKELQYIKNKYPNSVMTGSGSTYFLIDGKFKEENGYWVKNNLKSISYGVCKV